MSKYLQLLLLIHCILFQYIGNINAGAWVLNPNEYKVSSGFSIIDSKSHQNIKKRTLLFIEYKKQIDILAVKKKSIQKLQNDRELSNAEKRQIIFYDKISQELQNKLLIMSAFSDETMKYFDISYGLNNDVTIGAKISYTENKFPDILYDKLRRYDIQNDSKIGSDAQIFLQYRLFDMEHVINDRDSVTFAIKPSLQYSIYEPSSASYTLNLSLLSGYSTPISIFDKNSTNMMFCEYELAFKNINLYAQNHINFSLAASLGIKFKNNFFITQYNAYSYTNDQNFLYRKTLYQQIAIAKNFYFDNVGKLNFVAQIGYFVKRSLMDKNFSSSGPIFSVWCNL